MFSVKLGLALFFIGVVFVVLHMNYQRDLSPSGCVDCHYGTFMMQTIQGIPLFFWIGGIMAAAGFIITYIRLTLKKTLLLFGLGLMVFVIYNLFIRAAQ